jgi:hypothetical protein
LPEYLFFSKIQDGAHVDYRRHLEFLEKTGIQATNTARNFFVEKR